jgi:hypothetical protein
MGPEMQVATAVGATEPRAASVPPNGVQHFTAVVDGAENRDLIQTWSDLCQNGPAPPDPLFRAVYPHMTTVQGNRFRFRGGDPAAIKNNLERLFRDRMRNSGLRVHIES